MRFACAENLDDTFPAEFSLASLNGKNGFVIKGINGSGGSIGSSVSGAGDINGDGIADILIGAPDAIKGAGQTYIIFGSDKGWPSALNIDHINNGLIVNGVNDGDHSGYSVSKAGDFNGDGIDDILISAPQANNSAGQSYVLFGNKQGLPLEINLSDLDGNNGFTINCSLVGAKECGIALYGGGDFNGDGIADILLGTQDIATYVVFGGRKQWPATIDLLKVNGTDGFAIRGKNGIVGILGYSVTSIGDINADSIADILIMVAVNTVMRNFVLFGSKREWPAVFDISDSNGINGFFIDGLRNGHPRKNAVGDVNGDGIDDLWLADGSESIVSHIVFGSKEQWPAAIDITTLDSDKGFAIKGFKKAWYFVQGGRGDVNGDGIDDMLIGGVARSDLGESYVVFGRKKWPETINVTNLDGNNGFVIRSLKKGDLLGSSLCIAKDINGDGIDDILINAPNVLQTGGQTYVVFGRAKKTYDWLTAVISTVVLLSMGICTGYTCYLYYSHAPIPSPPTTTPTITDPLIIY